MSAPPIRDGTLPAEIRRVREQMGLSQEKFAAELGTTRYNVLLWEKGRRYPTAYREGLVSLGVPAAAFVRAGSRHEVEKRLLHLEGQIADIRALVSDWP